MTIRIGIFSEDSKWLFKNFRYFFFMRLCSVAYTLFLKLQILSFYANKYMCYLFIYLFIILKSEDQEMFSASLRYLKQSLLDDVNDRVIISMGDIKWVITVPAIWSEPAKTFMRRAAIQVFYLIINSLITFFNERFHLHNVYRKVCNKSLPANNFTYRIYVPWKRSVRRKIFETHFCVIALLLKQNILGCYT